MKKELSYLKYLIPVLNIIIVIQTIGLILGAVIMLFLSLMGIDGFVNWLTEFAVKHGGEVSTNLSEFPMTHVWLGWVALIDFIPNIALFVFIRKFCKNLLQGDIFIADNVKLAKYAAITLLLGGAFSIGFGPFSTAGDSSFINGGLLIAALLVWTISKVLEQANVIAEENDFTI